MNSTQLTSEAIPGDLRGVMTQYGHAIWRASQFGGHRQTVVATGYSSLDRELPDGGWPVSSLNELLIQQSGIGEMRLLLPTLQVLTKYRPIVLVQPPHLPQAAAWANWKLPLDKIIWIRAERIADALWSTEQVLRTGSCGAIVLWQTQVRAEALRRLHLAAQAGGTLFWIVRPLASAQSASPAPLRLAIRPAVSGLQIDIIKRRGPHCEQPVLIVPSATPTPSRHFQPATAKDSYAALDRHSFAPTLP